MKWLKIIFYIFLFSIGWMFGLFVEHWDVFHLSFDVPAFNIINLLVISLLAWLVNYTIQKSGRKVKSHIDLISGKIDEVDGNLKRIVELCMEDKGALYVEICNLDKRNRKWTKEIIKIVEKQYSDVCPNDTYAMLGASLVELRNMLTRSSIMVPGQPTSVAVNNNIIKYDDTRKAEVEVLVDSIRHILFRMKVNISQK